MGMELSLKSKDTWGYEVHRAGCSHLKKNAMQVFTTNKYETAEDFITADRKDDFEDEIPREDYEIMPCVK